MIKKFSIFIYIIVLNLICNLSQASEITLALKGFANETARVDLIAQYKKEKFKPEVD